jgi:epsilon-lactone hydrolase
MKEILLIGLLSSAIAAAGSDSMGTVQISSARIPYSALASEAARIKFSNLMATPSAPPVVEAQVDAELHVYEGMWHAFFINADLPESQATYSVIVRFFDRHLGV